MYVLKKEVGTNKFLLARKKHDDSGWKLVKKSELPVRGKWIIDTEGLLISITDGLLFPFNDGDEFFFWVSPIPETILNKIFTY